MRTSYPLTVELLAAVLISAASLAFRQTLDPVLDAVQPFAPGLVAVAGTVWFFGWRGGVLTALIVYFAAHYLFVEPRHAWSYTDIYDVSSLITNLMSSFIIVWIGQQARAARDRAVAANEQKNRFIAMVSHELRNPLAAMKNSLAGLRASDVDAGRRELFLAVMERQAAQMSEILSDLLDVSRIERGQITINPRRINLRECVEEAVARARPIAIQKGQEIVLDAVISAEVQADRTRIMQVLSNLLDNACKYTPSNSTINVQMTAGDPIAIRISDDGPGIPTELLPYLFDLSRPTSTRSSESGGLGVGLSVCRKLVELHGGTIEARNSEQGRGACFTILLPPAGSAARGSAPE